MLEKVIQDKIYLKSMMLQEFQLKTIQYGSILGRADNIEFSTVDSAQVRDEMMVFD